MELDSALYCVHVLCVVVCTWCHVQKSYYNYHTKCCVCCWGCRSDGVWEAVEMLAMYVRVTFTVAMYCGVLCMHMAVCVCMRGCLYEWSRLD